MKKLFLLISLCISIFAFADAQNYSSPVLKKGKATVNETKTEKPAILSLQKAKHQHRPQAVIENTLPEKKSPWFTSEDFIANNRAIKLTETKQRLDSVSFTNAEGVVYGKQKFIFSDTEKDVLIGIENHMLDDYSNEWFLDQDTHFEWNEKGLLVKKRVIFPVNNMEEVTEFEYDEYDRLKLELITMNNNGSVEPIAKAEHIYYETHREVFQYGHNGSNWQNQLWVKEGFDSNGYNTLLEEYNWDGEWVGSRKVEATYNATGKQTMVMEQNWDPDTDSWIKLERVSHEFNENDQILVQAFDYWNEEDNDWTGDVEAWDPKINQWVTLFNQKAVFTYDEEGKKINETGSIMYEPNVWTVRVTIECEYEPIEDNETQVTQTTYNHFEENKTYWKKYITHVDNTFGNVTYEKEWDYEVVIWEAFYTFDDLGLEIELHQIDLGDSQRYEIHQWWTRDERGNITSFESHDNANESGEVKPVSKFEYTVENDIRTSVYSFFYVDGEYVPGWGDGWEYDFTVPRSDLFIHDILASTYTYSLGLNTYPFMYKILKSHEYSWNGVGYDDSYHTYYYSPVEIEVPSATIAGTVKDENDSPIQGVTVQIANSSLSMITNDEGEYEFTDLRSGSYTLIFTKEGYHDKSEDVEAVVEETTTVDVILEAKVAAGNIKGTVSGTNNVGIEGVTISITGTDLTYTSRPNGEYIFENVAPGTYTLTFSKEGYEQKTETATVVDGEETIVNVTLEAKVVAGNIKGTVSGTNNVGIEGVTISITGTDLTYTSRPNGEYIFENVAPGTYTLTFSKEGYEQKTETATVVDGEERIVNVTLEAIIPISLDDALSNNINIYTDRATNIVYIEGAEKVSIIGIYDLSGNQVYSTVNNGNSKLEVNLSAFPQGTYIIKADNMSIRIMR